MNVAILIHEEYDFMFPLLRDLLPLLEERHEVRGVLTFPDVLLRYQGMRIPIEYFRRFGAAVVIRLALRSALNRVAILWNHLRGRAVASSYGRLCRSHGIPRSKFRNPNDPEVIAWLKQHDIDVGLIFIGFVLKEPVLRSVRGCFLNKHSSLLPFSRGVFPVFWSLMHGALVGLTIHKVVARLDAGEIILQKAYDIDRSKSVYDYYKILFGDAPRLIVESLAMLESGERRPIRHDLEPCYHTLPTRQDWLAFKKQGLKFA